MSYKRFFTASIFFALISAFFNSCATTESAAGQTPQEIQTSKHEKDKTEHTKHDKSQAEERESEITLLFAGDIMAHGTNYKFPDFDRIWRDIAPLVKESDLAFGNIEAPVAENLPWSTYPNFNMHQSYVEAAIKIGFNVFSLANNHTNDQFLQGIVETKKYFDAREGIWSSGLKAKAGDPLTYAVIDKNGWKILFVAITEILNTPANSANINYIPAQGAKREKLKAELKKLREENPCDLFVFSVHCDEPEYVHTIKGSQKEFYRSLISECDVDIIWANHPHIVREWEKAVVQTPNGQKEAFIMYSNGNTISAQRTKPSFSKPETERDNTGDGLIIKLKYAKIIKENKNGEKVSAVSSKAKLSGSEHYFITTFIAPSGQYVIKLLDDDFINTLDRAENTTWAKYLAERKKIMEKIREKSIY
ncbi:CapA family protein [Treponema zioleckii]|uniref:CapA family protein n=1 Tax=Treponema zioleckii TaxID=331680 RepID=UPI00168B8AA2|nr:CapA family protein [Treponema zioleckii]